MAAEGWVSTCERVAWKTLELAGQTERNRADLRAVIDRTGARTSPRAPHACHGQLQTDPLMIRLDERGHEHAVLADASHELGHLALWLESSILRWSESAATVTGAMIWIPKPRAIEAVQAVGLVPEKLCPLFPSVQPSLVAVRCALAAGGGAFVYEGGAPLAHVYEPASDAPHLETLLRAYSVYTAVKARGATVLDSTGIAGAEYIDHRRRSVRKGVVVLVPREAWHGDVNLHWRTKVSP